MNIIPLKIPCAATLRIPRRYMILSDFMLCPVFTGNQYLEKRYDRLNDRLLSIIRDQPSTMIEKGASALEILTLYYAER